MFVSGDSGVCGAVRGPTRQQLALPGRASLLGRPSLSRRIVLAASCAAMGALLLWCASAPASIGQGHVFGSSFGGSGSGEGRFEEATGVAVDEATGEVYVVDAKDERVEIFKPDGSGYVYSSQFKVRSPGAIAVDNSTSVLDPSRGDVYVVGSTEKEASAEERDVVYEYRPSEGKIDQKIYEFKSGEREEELEDVSGVAVDPNGVLWVYWEEEGVIDGFAKQLTKNGGVKLVWEPSLRREPEIESKFECSARQGFAVAPGDESFYVGYERESAREECPGEQGEAPASFGVAKLDGAAPAPRTLAREVDRGDTVGVAVEGSTGNLYVDNEASVAVFTPEGLLSERFGAEHLGEGGGGGIAVDSRSGDVFVAQASTNQVAVFEPDTVTGAPVVDGVSSRNLTAASTELRAQIDPRGVQTEYWFEYGTADCVSEEASCTRVPVPAGTIAAGFGERQVSVVVGGLQPATAYHYRVLAKNALGSVEGLPSVSTFTTLPSPSVLPDGRAWELVSPVEKHGAAIESIPNHAKAGVIQSAVDGGALTWVANGPVVSEPEGNRDFEFSQLISRRGPEGWGTQSLETPHNKGRGLLIPAPSEYHYFSPDLSQSLVAPTEPSNQTGGVVEDPPLSPLAPEKTMYQRTEGGSGGAAGFVPLVTAANDTAGTEFGGALEFLDATPDLEHVVFESKVGLTAAAPSAAGLYEWDASGGLRLVSVLPDGSAAPDEPGREPSLGAGGGLNARNALSTDGTRVFWTEADEEHLYLRDTQSGETIAVNAAQGNGPTEPGPGGEVLSEPEADHQEVRFQSASSDGSKVFFTDTARLTEDSGQEPVGEEAPADLYEFELASAPGEALRGRLSDLTADSPTASADVLNVIPGAGQDGANVYFVANGVLAAGATPGECIRDVQGEAPPPQPGATCNLYVSEPDPEQPGARETKFIAALSYEDAADWGSGNFSSAERSQGNLSGVTSGVSADGQYLAFMSQEPLTGYDNRDTTSGAQDDEVYLYDASTGRLICASCNPTSQGESGEWQRPHGVFDTPSSGEGMGLLVDRPETWQNRWLAGSIPGWTSDIAAGQPHALYQPRYLSDSGRLFFDSPDALVPADQNAKNDVYEYEPENVGSCQHSAGCLGLISSGTSDRESAFLDASENGDDVFFLTAAQLLPADTDHEFDIYDAHVCSQSSPCSTASSQAGEECDTTAACRPSSSPSVLVAVTPSATYSGPGNVNTAKGGVSPAKVLVKAKPLTRVQKLAKALKACRKLERKHKRAVCVARARKRYGAKPKAHSKAKTKKTASSRRGGGR